MSDENLKLAKAIKKHIDGGGNPSVPEIALALSVPEEAVVSVLDSHAVDEGGAVSHVGQGRGHGWIRQPEAEIESE